VAKLDTSTYCYIVAKVDSSMIGGFISLSGSRTVTFAPNLIEYG
jgi:hypothetical protein